MHLAPTEEQAAIQTAAADFLVREMPASRLHAAERRARIARDWRQLADMGWLAATLPEAHGGAGVGLIEEVLVFQMLGRALAPIGAVAAVVGAKAAHRTQRRDLLAQLIEGRPVAIGVPRGSDGHVQGFDAEEAPLLCVFAPDRVSLVRLDVQSDAIHPCLDVSSSVLSLDSRLLAPLIELSGAEASRCESEARLLLAAMAVGCAEGASAMASSYAATREQFGKPIGAFQAIKHMCVDMAMQCEVAASQLVYAALALAGQEPDCTFHAAAAKLLADRAAIANARANIQVHGGMGMTDECDAHLFLKRAHILKLLLAPTRAHLLS